MNRSSLFTLGVAAGLSLIARSVAQADGAGPIVPGNPQVALQYGSFDPKVGTLPIPAVLKAGADTRLWIVQFHGPNHIILANLDSSFAQSNTKHTM